MDPEVLERLKRINLTVEEGEVIKVRPSQREQILEEYSLSLLGKFHRSWPYNKREAKTFPRSAWKLEQDLKIVEVGDGLFQFKFSMESQLLWVVNNGPWSFDNHLLLLQRWEKGMTANSGTFTHLPIWVQVWGLPFDLFSEEVGTDIGKGLGRVVNVDSKVIASNYAHFLWIQVEIPLDKPICRGSKIQGLEGDMAWIAFKYERLIGLCFNCGRLDHEVKYCGDPMDVEGNGNQYGDWLKGGHWKQNKGESQYHYSPPQWNVEANSETRSTTFAESEQPPVEPNPQHRKTNLVISRTVMVTHMSHAGIKDIIDMGVSIPNKAGFEIVAPTHNVHTKCRVIVPHGANWG